MGTSVPGIQVTFEFLEGAMKTAQSGHTRPSILAPTGSELTASDPAANQIPDLTPVPAPVRAPFADLDLVSCPERYESNLFRA
jgi:hypothetical protein